MSTQSRSEETEASETRQKLRRSAKGTTCTHCRQLKLKCDSATVYPQDCSRCRRAGHRCVVDPTFRRRGNREYTQSLEKEVQSLRHLREMSPSSGVSPNDHPGEASSGSAGNVGGDYLDDVRLSPAMMISLIEMFYTCYHPYFPILPDQQEFLAEYDSNRLLLWTILTIASKGRDDIPDVYSSLVEPVRRLASDLYAPQSRSLKTMQALLLLCVWPFPFQQSINDPSPMYCSLATQIGYQLGLHRPLHKSDYDENAVGPRVCSPSERKTWYGCFIANQNLASRLGLPPTITPGNAIVSAVTLTSDPDVPQSLLLELNIAHMAYQWTQALGDDPSTSTGQSPSAQHSLPAFESEFARLEEKFKNCSWPKFLEIRAAGLKLQMYSFAINSNATSTREVAIVPQISRELLQAKALSATVATATGARMDAVSLPYWPVFARYSVMLSACMGVYMSGLARNDEMRAPLLDASKHNVQVLHGWALYPRDSFARIIKHITTTIRRIESHGSHGVLLTENGTGRPEVTSRMAGNIAYQLVWNAKHRKTPELAPKQPVTIPAPMPLHIAAHQYPPGASSALPAHQSQLEQVSGYSYADIDDSMFLEDWTEADFTDINLDWQSMLPVPGAAWPQAVSQ